MLFEAWVRNPTFYLLYTQKSLEKLKSCRMTSIKNFSKNLDRTLMY